MPTPISLDGILVSLAYLALSLAIPAALVTGLAFLCIWLYNKHNQQAGDGEKQPLNQAGELEVTVPAGSAGGSQIQVQTPSGLVAVQVPQGLGPGQKFKMTVAQV